MPKRLVMLDINYRDIPKKPIHRAAQLLLIFGIRILRGVRRFLATGYLKIVVRHCGVGCRICGGVQVFGPQNIVLGDGVVINEGVILQSCDNAAINIGNHVRLSYGSYLITGGLDVSGDYQSSRHVSGPIHIEDYAWIGARAVILPGVTIGKGAIVAAGAVVTRDVEEFTIMAGIPAKRIGNRAIH